MPNPSQIAASSVDPDLANAALGKIAAGQGMDTLSQAEKAAVGKMNPAVVAQARNKITAPKAPIAGLPAPAAPPPASGGMAPKTLPTADAMAAGVAKPTGVTPGSAAEAMKQMPNMPPLMGQYLADQNASDTADAAFAAKGKFSAPAGNSAENQGLLPNGHYAGTASYDGSQMRDPVALADSIPPPSPALTGGGGKATPPVNPTGYDMVMANRVSNAPTQSYPVKLPPDIPKAKMAGIISDIIDAMGGGMRAYGGVDSPTRLMQQGKINMQNQGQYNLMRMQLDAELEQKKQLLPLEVRGEIDKAKAVGDYARVNAILEAKGVQGLKLEQIREAAKLQAAGIRSPEQAALGIFGQ